MESRDVDESNVITRTNLGVVASTAEEMDERRRNTRVVDYLRKLDEAKNWIEYHTGEKRDLAGFIEELPKGEWLGKIVRMFDDKTRERVYISDKREYLHTDNINMFLNWLRRIKLSRHFYFEVIDLYESKNIPKVIYCIHGLAYFMCARGMSRGINRSESVFTEADKALVGGDAEMMDAHCYEDIADQVVSEEDCVGVPSEPKEPKEPIEPIVPKKAAVLRAFSRALLWRSALLELYRGTGVSVPVLRRFISYDSALSVDEQRLNTLRREIFDSFRRNLSMQEERDSVLRAARLLLENQARLRGIDYTEYPLGNDYRLFKRVVYNLLHDYDLLYKICSSGYELPLRAFYPDSRVGDYHFSKFVEYVAVTFGEQEAFKLARSHFLTSRAFDNLRKFFDSPADAPLNLSPVAVAADIRLSLGGDLGLGRRALLDEAIKDPRVREEIVRRADALARFVGLRLDYIGKMDFPFYASLFVSNSQFFEEFIEPAILLSRNFIVAELVKYVFYSRDLFTEQTHAFDQERLVYYGCRFDRTSDFDLADYSPLRDWLESDAHKAFYASFLLKNKAVQSANEEFLGRMPDSSIVQIETSIEEVNNMIIVLKENIELMDKLMASMVNKMTLLKQKPEDAQCIEVYNEEGMGEDEACIKVVGKVVEDAPVAGDRVVAVHLLHDGPVEARTHKCNRKTAGKAVEKFILRLDTQFTDLETDDYCTLTAIESNLITRLVILLSVSTEPTIRAVLGATTEAEVARFKALNSPFEDLRQLKKSVQEDIEFLGGRRLIQPSCAVEHMMNNLARSIVNSRCAPAMAESQINADNLDAAFKKGLLLEEQLKGLYAYSTDLFKKMVTNKSGVIFNRQAAPHSVYGTYSYPLAALDPVLFEDIDPSNLRVIISMDEPLSISLSVMRAGRTWSTLKDISFCELLRLQEDRVPSFDFNGIMSLSVRRLADLVNEQYIRY